ncbi:unnamed protein product, partial [Laminaria digitata]
MQGQGEMEGEGEAFEHRDREDPKFDNSYGSDVGVDASGGGGGGSSDGGGVGGVGRAGADHLEQQQQEQEQQEQEQEQEQEREIHHQPQYEQRRSPPPSLAQTLAAQLANVADDDGIPLEGDLGLQPDQEPLHGGGSGDGSGGGSGGGGGGHGHGGEERFLGGGQQEGFAVGGAAIADPYPHPEGGVLEMAAGSGVGVGVVGIPP